MYGTDEEILNYLLKNKASDEIKILKVIYFKDRNKLGVKFEYREEVYEEVTKSYIKGNRFAYKQELALSRTERKNTYTHWGITEANKEKCRELWQMAKRHNAETCVK